MMTFVSTIKFTPQGLKSIGDTTKRAAAVREMAKKLGIQVTNILWTLGDFDGLLLFEAPDDQAATALMLKITSQGNVQSSTTRAFSAAEMDAILSK